MRVSFKLQRNREFVPRLLWSEMWWVHLSTGECFHVYRNGQNKNQWSHCGNLHRWYDSQIACIIEYLTADKEAKARAVKEYHSRRGKEHTLTFRS